MNLSLGLYILEECTCTRRNRELTTAATQLSQVVSDVFITTAPNVTSGHRAATAEALPSNVHICSHIDMPVHPRKALRSTMVLMT